MNRILNKRPPVVGAPVHGSPVRRPPVQSPPAKTTPVNTIPVSGAVRVFLATADKTCDFLKFAAVPRPHETASGRFDRHCVYYNALCCQFVTLRHFPAKQAAFSAALSAAVRTDLDLLHLCGLFVTLLGWAEQQGDAAAVAATQALWKKSGRFGRLKADLPWVAVYDPKADVLGIVSSRAFAASAAGFAGKALPAGFAAGLVAGATQRIAAPFAGQPATTPPHVGGIAHRAPSRAAGGGGIRPLAASGPQVDPTAVTVLAGVSCAGSLAAVIGTAMSVPETGPIGAALTLRILGGMASADGACSVFLLRITADASGTDTAPLPAPAPVLPGELMLDGDGGSGVMSPEPGVDGEGDDGGEAGNGPIASDPGIGSGWNGDEPVSDPGDDPGDGNDGNGDPSDGPIASDPTEGPISSGSGEGPIGPGSGDDPEKGGDDGGGTSANPVSGSGSVDQPSGSGGGGDGGDGGGGGGGGGGGIGEGNGGEMKDE
ncbi:MAG: hypothetical protein INR65_08210, partial [Gluconacetobacter diazotrophicus]|nr:hypothetical protein [Gluconacetobacter diazotrophicus]